MYPISMVGKKFGRLLVLEAEGRIRKEYAYKCLCDCGSLVRLPGNPLRSGATRSCGCLQRDTVSYLKIGKTHGMSHTPLYSVWKGMVERCTSPSATSYARYGGSGVTVCDRWLTFENFYADMGDKPEGLTLDRVKNHFGYSPDNCRWATRKEQADNRKTTTMIEFNGETLCLTDWAKKMGLSPGNLRKRLDRWDFERAMTELPRDH